ncbi:MAG: retention module-containing protein, partial [Deltaproteobacteria bacterium]
MTEARAIATVVEVSGNAYVRTLDGELRALKPGDVIHEGELIMTSSDGRVQVDFGDNSAIEMTPNQAIKVTDELVADLWPDQEQGALADATANQLIQALREGRSLDELIEEPAAGGNQAGDEGNSFVELTRILEQVNPVAFNFSETTLADLPEPDFARGLPEETTSAESVPSPTDTLPEIHLSGETVVESDGVISFQVTLSQPVTTPVSVSYSTFGQSATSGADFSSTSGTITFAPGETVKTIQVPVANDLWAEGSETLQLQLSNPVGATIADPTVMGTIVDEPTGDIVTLDLSGPANVTEGDTATYTLTVSNPPATDLDIDVVTGHITTDNGDLTPVTTTVTIPAGSTSVTFDVVTTDDAVVEGNEAYQVQIAGTSGGGFENLQVGTGSVTTTIIDNEGTPAFAIDDVSVDEAAGTATFTVT